MPSNFIRFISGPFLLSNAALKTAALCAVLGFWSAVSLSAQTSTWTNDGSGPTAPLYELGGNWNTGAAPSANEIARFDLNATYQVRWDDISLAFNPSVGRIDVVGRGNVTFLNSKPDEQLEFEITGSGLGVLSGAALSIDGLHLNLTDEISQLRVGGGSSVTVGGSHSQGSTVSANSVLLSESQTRLNTLPNGRINVGEISDSAPGANISIGGSGLIQAVSGSSINTGSIAVGASVGTEASRLVMDNSTLASESLVVGQVGKGELHMESGATALARDAVVGQLQGSVGNVIVAGQNTLFQATNSLTIGGNSPSTHGQGQVEVSDSARIVVGNDLVFSTPHIALNVGSNSPGSLAILDIGEGSLLRVSDGDSYIGGFAEYSGQAIIAGAGARLENERLFVGVGGQGVLTVLDGGTVVTDFARFGFSPTSLADVTVSGSDSNLEVNGNTEVGDGATVRVSNDGVISTSKLSMRDGGTLNINAGGLVRVSAETEFLGSDSSVNLLGGRFEFGRTSMEDFALINASAVSGAMAGDIRITGTNNIADFNALKSSNADISQVNLVNNGTLVGDAALESGLVNEFGAAIQIAADQRMRFGGAENSNAGDINLTGGRIEFASNLIHQSSGFISGHGVFMASEWTNDGVLQFTDGDSEIHGAITQGDTGVIVVDGFGDATFHDDVIITSNDNQNIFVANGSTAFMMGSFNGGNGGEGDVQVMGTLTPGNSPASVSFGGDLSLADGSELQIELGGVVEGRFDQVFVMGDLFLDGALDVALIDGFTLEEQQEFLIIDVAGTRTGLFDGLADGGLVGNFDGVDLFINYGAGDGNDIGLTTSLTAIPEPTAAWPLLAMLCGLSVRRIRKAGCLTPNKMIK